MSFHPIYPHTLSLLPPKIDLEHKKIHTALLRARTELAELKGYSSASTNPMLLISPSILRESVASSYIENIHTTMVDVLQNQLFPESEQKEDDKEVLRYRDAVLWGFANLKKHHISEKLILGIQKRLVTQASGGVYRNKQNVLRMGATKKILYTPPSPARIKSLMHNWERFVQKRSDIDPLLKCIIAHYQFEAIHPFADGNGRTGRILMVLQMLQDDMLHFPVLYVSGYINTHRAEYYKLLRNVTIDNTWDEFILFMLKAFYIQAKQTKNTLIDTIQLFTQYKEELKTKHKKIYSAELVEALFAYPVITPVKLGKELNIHYTTASRHLIELAKKGMLKEKTHGKYHMFANYKLLNILNKS